MTRKLSSRLAKVQAKKDRQQALLFILLSLAFLLLVIFLGFKVLTKAALLADDMHASSQNISKNDNIPPIIPRLNIDFEATNSAQINISGQSEPGSTVVLFKNDEQTDQVVADEEGQFLFTKINLFPGDNTIKAYAKDTSENKSNFSKVYIINYDKVPPKLKITHPNDGDKFYDQNQEILISGETDKNTQVKVIDFWVPVDPEGNFVKKILLKDGENEITVTAKDKAGNQTVKTIKVFYSH